MHKNSKFSLVDVALPPTNSYLLIEALKADKNAARIIHVLEPAPGKMSFKLGRGHDSEIRIADISVSRLHAYLRFAPEGCFLDDNRSKFGSLVLVPKDKPLLPERPVMLQVGRTVIDCIAKKVSQFADLYPSIVLIR